MAVSHQAVVNACMKGMTEWESMVGDQGGDDGVVRRPRMEVLVDILVKALGLVRNC